MRRFFWILWIGLPIHSFAQTPPKLTQDVLDLQHLLERNIKPLGDKDDVLLEKIHAIEIKAQKSEDDFTWYIRIAVGAMALLSLVGGVAIRNWVRIEIAKQVKKITTTALEESLVDMKQQVQASGTKAIAELKNTVETETRKTKEDLDEHLKWLEQDLGERMELIFQQATKAMEGRLHAKPEKT